MKKRILCIVLSLFLLFGLTACTRDEFTPTKKTFNTKVTTSTLSDGEVIAQNSKFAMQYVAENGAVKLVDLNGENTWDICPKSVGEIQYDDFGLPITGEHVFVGSAIEVGYMDPTVRGGGNGSATSIDAAVELGRIVVKKIENGVTIEYYFDGQKIMVPVDYVLADDYLSISVDSSKIQEENLRITYVSLAPFMNSVQNDTENSYLFMPSGSGALVGIGSHNEQGIAYSQFFYGDDYTMEDKYTPTERESLRMPVYGYKTGNKGGFVIVDKGAEIAELNSIIGSTSYKFSTIYSKFLVRGYTYHQARTFKQTYYANVYPENMIECKFSLRFYPLSGENVDYNTMADIYQDYLVNEKGLVKTGEEKPVNISLIGGTQITKSFLGVPYETVYATTTAKQAGSIITELSEKIDDLSVQLKGFGSSGVDLGKIGGGYTVNSNIGSNADLKKLSSVCKDKKIDLYYDYDLVRFNSSGSGFSHYGDAVMNSGVIKTEQYVPDKANRGNNEKQAYRLLRPICFNDAVSKAIKHNSGLNISGLSLETLTSLAYSDYSDPHATIKYNSRYGYVDTVKESLKKIKSDKQKLMASDANDYAAIAADLVVDVPVTSDDAYSFFEDVPFYSMVFKGYVPMTSESVNLAIKPQRIVLGAVESGIGLNYTITNQWDNVLIDAVYPYFYATLYADVKDDIIANYSELADYYKKIDGAKIVSNTIVESGVHCTVFDNGVTVYVNYNNSAVSTPAGECAAEGYIITGGVA